MSRATKSMHAAAFSLQNHWFRWRGKEHSINYVQKPHDFSHCNPFQKGLAFVDWRFVLISVTLYLDVIIWVVHCNYNRMSHRSGSVVLKRLPYFTRIRSTNPDFGSFLTKWSHFQLLLISTRTTNNRTTKHICSVTPRFPLQRSSRFL